MIVRARNSVGIASALALALCLAVACASSSPVVILYKAKGAYGVGSMPNSLFSFKSSNPAVFTVDAKGVVHAKGEGSAKLTVTAKKKKSCKLVQTIYVSDFVDEGAFMAADD